MATAVFVVIASVMQMVIPSLLSKMINDGVSGKNERIVIGIGIAMIVLSVVACVMQAIATRLSASITTKFSADLRMELFYKIQIPKELQP